MTLTARTSPRFFEIDSLSTNTGTVVCSVRVYSRTLLHVFSIDLHRVSFAPPGIDLGFSEQPRSVLRSARFKDDPLECCFNPVWSQKDADVFIAFGSQPTNYNTASHRMLETNET